MASSVVVAGAERGSVAGRIVRELVATTAEAWGWEVGRALDSRATAAASMRLLRTAAGRRLQAVSRRTVDDALAICLGPHGLRHAAPTLASARGRRVAYILDAWPSTWADCIAMADQLHLHAVAVSARDAALALASADDTRPYVWVPEGLPPSRLQHVPARPCDVLEIGRRWDRYHEAITPALQQAGCSHVYQQGSALAASSDEDLLALLAGATVSVCFPRATSHPGVSGGLSTMTLRYLEGMAHHCLIVGEQPTEMAELFPWGPVVPADVGDPAGQLLDVLASIDSHSSLIERNRAAVRTEHLWEHRLPILAALFTR